ncbi:unnamed protein product [Cyprideis torosa]|uniref:Uncharacterized protein n=1 Tax=Cyprideis torosa TaxID=163714 RepID=A0A7R8W0Q7_9CRUS|nr:unnamed protein product [Cyprideis torosa]CAG0879986.1 unnamed protein product [Cyprideis torosa]
MADPASPLAEGVREEGGETWTNTVSTYAGASAGSIPVPQSNSRGGTGWVSSRVLSPSSLPPSQRQGEGERLSHVLYRIALAGGVKLRNDRGEDEADASTSWCVGTVLVGWEPLSSGYTQGNSDRLVAIAMTMEVGHQYLPQQPESPDDQHYMSQDMSGNQAFLNNNYVEEQNRKKQAGKRDPSTDAQRGMKTGGETALSGVCS